MASITGANPTTDVELAGRKISQSLKFDLTDKAVMKALEAVTTKEVREFVKSLEVIQSTQIEVSLYSLFEFMGFDPIQVIKKLILVNRHYRNEMKVAEETEEVLKQDILLMIAANIYMGNLQVKSVSRRSATARFVITYLQQKYAMRIGSTGAGLPADVLTFPRVANSFPVITVRMASVLPSKDFISGKFKTTLLPKWMRVSAFASFCPIEMAARTRLFLLHAVCAYTCDQSVIVSEGESKKPQNKSKKIDILKPEEAFGLQWNFIFVASSSPVPSFGMRKAIHTEFQTDKHYGNLKPIVENLRSIIKDKTPIPSETEFIADLKEFVDNAKRGTEGKTEPEKPRVEEVEDEDE